MKNSESEESVKGGISRRDLMRRGIKTGAGLTVASWTVPALHTIALAQTGDGSPPPPPPPEDGQPAISFVALLVECDSKLYRIKWNDTDGFQTAECGPNFATGTCDGGDGLLRHDDSIENGCPPDVDATFNSSNGTVTVSLGDCEAKDFIVKCGQCCSGPNEGGQPGLSGSSLTFVPCSSNKEGCA